LADVFRAEYEKEEKDAVAANARRGCCL